MQGHRNKLNDITGMQLVKSRLRNLYRINNLISSTNFDLYKVLS